MLWVLLLVIPMIDDSPADRDGLKDNYFIVQLRPSFILMNDSLIQNELNLEQAQRSAIARMTDTFLPQLGAAVQLDAIPSAVSPENVRHSPRVASALNQVKAKFNAEIETVLTSAQTTRLRQLQRQLSGLYFYVDPTTQKWLSLDSAQIVFINQASVALASKERELAKTASKTKTFQKDRVQLDEKFVERVNLILNASQKQTVSTLLGKPVSFDVTSIQWSLSSKSSK